MAEYKVEYKHQQVGMPFPVYCTDRDASAVRMLFWQNRQQLKYDMALDLYDFRPAPPRRPHFATDPAELRWMADIAAGDDVWGS